MYSEGRPVSEDGSQGSGGSLPDITSEQYHLYIKSLIKLLVGETTLLEWLKKGTLTCHGQAKKIIKIITVALGQKGYLKCDLSFHR